MRVLISEAEIASRIDELAEALSTEYRGRPLTVVGVLSGSLLFLADLMRRLDVPHQIGFLQASSYRTGTKSGQLTVNQDYFPQIVDRDVLLIDDIFDTGKTLQTLHNLLIEANPRSIKTAVLLWKRGTQQVDALPDYHCFQIPDEFVVGYGLDYQQNYRHLPYIAVLEPHDLPQVLP
jgi:hypoxanthine phosphoribosyltransferase